MNNSSATICPYVLKYNTLVHYERLEVTELLKSTSGQIHDGGRPRIFNP